MRIGFMWNRCIDEAAELRMARLQRVLLAARNTPFYRPRLESAGLRSAVDVIRLNRADIIQDFPPTFLEEYLLDSDRFRNRRFKPRGPHAFRYPHGPAPRTAALGCIFQENRNLRCFDSWGDLAGFEPEALAAPSQVLTQQASRAVREAARVPRLTHAIIALTPFGEPLLTPAHRDLLWDVFHVPVYEQITGLGGETMAWECEAHEGRHVDPGDAIFEALDGGELLVTPLLNLESPVIRLSAGVAGRIETAPCPCGQEGLRILIEASGCEPKDGLRWDAALV